MASESKPMQTFEEYLSKKKIDSVQFREAEPERWQAWKVTFEQMHPDNFTQQKLFLINETRRKYRLKEEENAVTDAKPKTGIKPKIRLAPKPKKRE
ncbi:MAG: hypothetical protein ACLFT3_14555 [Cyclobacteriaceae bacterium]